MQPIVRKIARAILPGRVRLWVNTFRHGNVQRLELPQRVDKPEGRRVLVIAPHPDDEAIGCGGTLLKHKDAGDRIVVAYMTDGERGDTFVSVQGAQLIALRRNETELAARILGIHERVFCANPDTQLKLSEDTIEQMLSLLGQHRPDVLYVPSYIDGHTDHQAAFQIVASALRRFEQEPAVYTYEVWSPLVANCVVEIDMDRKLEAVRAYASQLGQDELYVSGCTGLAKYRAVSGLLRTDTYAECFWRSDRAGFLRLADALAAGDEPAQRSGRSGARLARNTG
jgi:N-acetylglucosamine malate deacetylase 1